MSSYLHSIFLASTLVLLSACSDDASTGPADATLPDAALNDATPDAALDATGGDASSPDASGPADASPDAGERNTSCDNSELICDATEPTCEAGEIAAIRGGCWECVNAISCLPWGMAGCAADVDCSADEYCNSCATSSCAGCADCVAACVPHDCETEDDVTCRMLRPDCGEGNVAVARATSSDGPICWVCVSRTSCESVETS